MANRVFREGNGNFEEILFMHSFNMLKNMERIEIERERARKRESM